MVSPVSLLNFQPVVGEPSGESGVVSVVTLMLSGAPAAPTALEGVSGDALEIIATGKGEAGGENQSHANESEFPTLDELYKDVYVQGGGTK